MLLIPLVIKGTIQEIGDGLVTGGALTKYSFIRVDGKIYKDIVANNYFSSFIRVGNTVRIGLKRQLAGGPVICSLENNGEIHRIAIGSVIVPTLAIALVSLVVFSLLSVGFGASINTAIKVAIFYPIFLLLYLISWLWPRQALRNNAVDDGLSAKDWGLTIVGLLLFPLSIVFSIYNFANSRISAGLLHLGMTSVAGLVVLMLVN